MLPSILRQASQFILAQAQPKYRRFLYSDIDFSERLICVKGARGAGKTTLLLPNQVLSSMNLQHTLL